MKRMFAILILLISAYAVDAQNQLSNYNGGIDTGKMFSTHVKSVFYKPFVYSDKMVKEIPKDIYTCNFGFFCKQELKMHKAHVPVSVRLGSFEYCDYLEQKGSKVR